MRTDRALDIARDPSNAEHPQLVEALVALRHAHTEAQRRLDDVAPALSEAGDLRLQRGNIEGRLRSALILHERDTARVREVLDMLDIHAPDEARYLRAAWGIWPVQPG